MSEKKRLPSIKSSEKYKSAFFLGFICIFITLLPIVIAEKGYFIYYGDFNAQQIPFYTLANDAAKNGGFGWNWFTDLGCDFMTSYSFYLFGSPFFRLSSLLPRSLAACSLPVLLAVKHGVASLTAYAYIRRFVRTPNAALIGGLLYSYSGFQLFNIFFNHFQDVTALFPLMLIAMEECINNRRKGWFALSVALLAIDNYYFFAGQAVFLVAYYLFRMKCPDFSTSWKKFFGLAFEAILGTLIAAFVLLSSALAIMGNYRVNQRLFGLDMVIYSDKTLIPRIIQTFFMPADAPARPNLFTSEYEKWASIGGFLPLFSMSGVAAFMKSKRKHWATRFTIFCIVCAFIPILNSAFQAMNGYYYARWFYMPILIMSMMSALALDDENTDMKFGLKVCGIALAAFGIIGLLPKKNSDDKIILFELPERVGYFWIQFGVAAVCLAAAYYIYRLKKKGRSFLKLSVTLTAAASIACSYTMILYGAYNLDSANDYIDKVINGRDKVYESVSDDNFFRVDMSKDCDNYPMAWGLPSMRAFQSVVTTSIMDFYEYVGVHRDVASRADSSHYTLRGLLSVKYFYKEILDDCTYENLKSGKVTMPDDCDKDSRYKYEIIPEKFPGFEYVGENGGFEIYENTLYMPMGIAYDSYLPREVADDTTGSIRERSMIKALIFEDSEREALYSDILSECTREECKELSMKDYENICLDKKDKCSASFSYDEYGFKSEITLNKPSMVFYSVPYSEGWTAEVNGKTVVIEKVDDGFMAVKGEVGDNTIIFRYETPGLKTGILLTISGAVVLAAYVLICRRKKNDSDVPDHTHYYDYTSVTKIKASENYLNSFGRK